MTSLNAAGRTISIKIPLLMLGPYLRGFLYGCIAIFGGLAVLLFLLALCFGRQPATCEGILKAAMNVLLIAITFAGITLLFHFFGMP